jgi:hypothetical protein
VVAQDAVEQRQAPLLGQAAGRCGDDLGAEREVAEQPPRLAHLDLGAVAELARLAHVVQQGGRHQQVGVEPGMKLADLGDERADGDGVLEETAEIGMVAAAGAGGAAELRGRVPLEEDLLDHPGEARVVHLTR